ncbi:secreted protein containing DUF1312 [Candidatus Magnetoovum chiemensis]|nr:secreted protein containing DUF1312 [Candidatus Magnetoovum chiemensis]
MRLSLQAIIKRLTYCDLALFGFLLTLSMSSMAFTSSYISNGSIVTIEADNKTVYRLSISDNAVVEVNGVEVEIKDSKVRVKRSNCPNKLCMKQGWISKGAIICLPKKVVITVEGLHDDSGIDAATG